MPNPAGYNGIDPVEPAYGARKQMGAMQKSAPLAGQPSSAAAQETPRRAKRRAVRPQGAVETAATPAPAPSASPQAGVAEFWQQAAPFLDPDLAWLASG